MSELRSAIITQVIHLAITFLFVWFISFRTFYEILPAFPELGFLLIPFVISYLILGILYLLLLILWIRWRGAPGKHKKGLLYSSLILAITSLFPPLLFGLIPALLAYYASSRS